jgi:hypothetical protein
MTWEQKKAQSISILDKYKGTKKSGMLHKIWIENYSHQILLVQKQFKNFLILKG